MKKNTLEENLLYIESIRDNLQNENNALHFSLAMCVEDRLSLELKHQVHVNGLKSKVKTLEKENVELHNHQENMALKRMEDAKDVGLKGQGENRHLNLEEQRNLISAIHEGVHMVGLKEKEIDYLKLQLVEAKKSHKHILTLKKSEYERTIQKLIESHATHEKEMKDTQSMMQSNIMRHMKSKFLKLSNATKRVQHNAKVSIVIPRRQYRTYRMMGEDFRSKYLREQEKRLNLQTLVKSIHQEATGMKIMKVMSKTATEKLNIEHQSPIKAKKNEQKEMKTTEQSVFGFGMKETIETRNAETFRQLEQLKKEKLRLEQENKDSEIQLQKYKHMQARHESREKALLEDNLRLQNLLKLT